MKNMKIPVEINEQGESTLDEIVAELERLGYKPYTTLRIYGSDKLIVADEKGNFIGCISDMFSELLFKPITLSEIRSMNIETLKEM